VSARPAGRGRGALGVIVADLLDRPGERRPVRTTVSLDDLQLSSSGVAPDADIEVDLVLEAVLGGRLTATGTVTAPWTGTCRRCLEPVEGILETEVREVFTEPAAEDADDPDLLPIRGSEIDLEPVVREAVLLGLPLAPLCRPDCPGPDPEGTPVAVEGDDPSNGRDAARGDPRWAALDDLHFDE
jgi:uncharacterized protein